MTQQDIDYNDLFGFDRIPYGIIEQNLHDLISLKGKKAVVTGAGGQGLGRAIANRLAGIGAEVTLVDLNEEGARINAAEVESRWGTKTHVIAGDISQWDVVHDVARQAREQMGGLDIFINNPVQVRSGKFEDMTKSDIDYTVNGALTMAIYGAHAAIEQFLPQRHGTIVNISSVGGRIQHDDIAVYNAAKSGVIGLTRNLAHEFAGRGIRIHGVAPGVMIKPSLKAAITADTDNEQVRAARNSMMESVTKYIQLGRVSIPEEVANMVAYLCTNAASYMVGQTIDVAGGQVMN